MKNMVVLYKTKDGKIYCQQITEAGIKLTEAYMDNGEKFWTDGGTIVLNELEEILDREV